MEKIKEDTSIPKEVIELSENIKQFNKYHSIIMNASFPGKACKVVEKMLHLIKDMHDQVLEQYKAHPWVIEENNKNKDQEIPEPEIKAPDFSQVPEDVKQLNKDLGDFGDYQTLLQHGEFRGRDIQEIKEMVELIQGMYDQTLDEYNDHPWVIEQRNNSKTDKKD